MPDALSHIRTRDTPQSEPADARQVQNSAGGFTFTVAREAKLHRFLTLGTEGGTYYTSERKLTQDNAKSVIEYAQGDPGSLVDETVAISQAGRAPRNNPALFALAAASGLAPTEWRRYALGKLPDVARTGTHLFTFLGYVQGFRGWGRQLRRAVSEWYLSKDAQERLAYQVLKYRQREGWTHRDALRLSHPAPTGMPAHARLFRFITGHTTEVDAEIMATELPLVDAFLRAQRTTKVQEWLDLLEEFPALSWEMLPDAALNEPKVWEMFLANGMPQTALMRQLPRLTRLGVLTPMSQATRLVTTQLTNETKLRQSRVHPISILIALRTYASGHSMRGDTTWAPVNEVTDALDAAFYLAFGTIRPAHKRTLVALDVSGSMTSPVSGLPLQCREASAAIGLVTLATEPSSAVVGFTAGGYGADYHRYGWGVSPLNIGPRQRLDDVVHRISGLSFGGTDCALPMIWALQNQVQIDHFEVITDNETWAGQIHPHQALRQYREKMGIDARMSVVGMTATDFTIADPADVGMLDVAGFDSAVPQLIADFARGDI